MILTRPKAPPAAPCSWCGSAQPKDAAGWTERELADSFVARYNVRHRMGGWTENSVTAQRGTRTACPACSGDLDAGRYAAVAARSDGGPSTAPYIEAVARRLGPAMPITKEKTR